MSARRLAPGAAVLLAAAAFPDAASAHGLVGKQDLPIPQWLFAWAASVVLIASFVALATRRPPRSISCTRLRGACNASGARRCTRERAASPASRSSAT